MPFPEVKDDFPPVLAEWMTSPHDPDCTQGVARALGVDTLLIFLKDSAVGIFLPALPFSQTLPDAGAWRSWLKQVEVRGTATADLSSPTDHNIRSFEGWLINPATIVSFGGGQLQQQLFMAWKPVFQIIAAYLENHQRRGQAETELSLVRQTSDELLRLTRSLEQTRNSLEATLHDLQRQRKISDQMREAAENASRAKDRFVAALSHELRGPLMPVFMSLSLLQKDEYITKTHGPQLERMERNLKSEERLINDLLDLSRILHQKLDLRFEMLSIHSLLQCLVEQHQVEAAKRNQQIHLSLSAHSDCILGDADRICQALSNLLSNAVKFSSPGGITQVRTFQKDDQLVVEVQDRGQGIRSELLQSVFDPFERGEASAGIEGLGLGLAITKEIILAHRGTIEAFSDGPGSGSTFRIAFKRASPATAEAEQTRGLSVLEAT